MAPREGKGDPAPPDVQSGVQGADDDLAVERRQWRADRAGRWVLTAVIVAAIAGLLGPGPLSGTTASDGEGGLEVDYERFVRRQRATEVVIAAPAPPADNGIVNSEDRALVEVRLDASWLAGFEVRAITPVPVEVRRDGDWWVHRFAHRPGARFDLRLDVVPLSLWRTTARVELGDVAVRFWQFAYP